MKLQCKALSKVAIDWIEEQADLANLSDDEKKVVIGYYSGTSVVSLALQLPASEATIKRLYKSAIKKIDKAFWKG